MPHLAHVIALRPTDEQARMFRRAAGCARCAYNWGLRHWQENYAAGAKPTWMSVQKEFVSRIDNEFPFMRDVPASAYAQAFRHLGKAFSRFFKKQATYPVFKKKHRSPPRFKLVDCACDGLTVRIPRIGIVRTTEALRFSGRIISATVTATAGRWSIAVLVDVSPDTYRCSSQATSSVIGIDLGLKMMATLSDGTQVASPKPLRHHLRRLRRLNRQLSRRHRGSHRHARTRDRLAREHARISRIRQAFLHSLTTDLVKTHNTIVIEDLHVAGLITNHTLARSVSDAGWGECRRQLAYKCARYQRFLVIAPRFYPSSKRCSRCGHVTDVLPLKQRLFICNCGLQLDRDHNAALNLKFLSTVAETGIHARGEPIRVALPDLRLHCPARRSVNPNATPVAKSLQKLTS